MPTWTGPRILRLLLTEECDRHCPDCCNKDWDLKALPLCQSYKNWDLILLTGGEPLLFPDKVMAAIHQIRQENLEAPIFLYTAMPNKDLLELAKELQGITLTLHETTDVRPFLKFHKQLMDWYDWSGLRLRLNIFEGVEISTTPLAPVWNIKSGIQWIKDCPLPPFETFMRWKGEDHERASYHC